MIMKLIRFKDKLVNFPTRNSNLIEIIREASNGIILSSDTLPTRPVRGGEEVNFKIDVADKLLNKVELPSTGEQRWIICLYKVGFTGDTLSELLSLNPQITVHFEKTKSILFDSFEGLPEKSSKVLQEWFAISRVNGPTDKFIDEVSENGTTIKYDVNSRINMKKGPYELTTTYVPYSSRMMAKLLEIGKSDRVILQSDFDLWTMALLVLVKQYKEAAEMFNELLNKLK